MLGIVYLLLCFLSGYVICALLFPELGRATAKTFKGTELSMSKLFVLVPAWFVCGTLAVTWVTYILAYIFGGEAPLIRANQISLSVFIAFCAAGLYIIHKKNKSPGLKGSVNMFSTSEIVFLFIAAILVYILMWHTFYVSHNHLYVGLTVYSDFSPHLGMIRSFSSGNNFPTQYSHFAGADIRYHFMFQFLVGNLEFLGMRIDYAFNIPSFLSLLGTFSVLYVLAVKLSGKRLVGFLSCLFLAFRSSNSFFTYLASIPKADGIINTLAGNQEFIGYTTNENWGLWNLNVYCNQRHFAFSLIVLILLLILFLPQLYEMEERVVRETAMITSGEEKRRSFFGRALLFLKLCFLKKEGWKVKNPRLAIASGVLLGSIAFWNGAVLIAALAILFCIAAMADRRLEYLIMAVIAGVISFAQTSFFVSGDVVSPQFFFGFIAENKTVFGVMDYIVRLLGILPLMLIIVFAISRPLRRYTMFAFCAPFILAFTLSLTTDVTVNHKYVMIAVMLLNIFVAIFVATLFENRKTMVRILCITIVICMTVTGMYDFRTVLVRNSKKNIENSRLVFNLEDDVTMWIKENTDSGDMFLTSNYALNHVVLGGAMLYLGWPYFGWSAGYDTVGRALKVSQMYGADSQEELLALVREEGIDYIIVDIDNRSSADYELNEALIAGTFEAVFESGQDEWKTTIYRVN